MKWNFYTLLFLFGGIRSVHAQTDLMRGDIAIVGVATNIGDDDTGTYCEIGANTGRDRISFVCFKDITDGTTIDFTDNGWERLLAGKWGNSEGFLSITRTGGTIPAGTTVTIELPRTGGGDPLGIVPDNGWSYSQLGTRACNFGSNGDQLYILQGGAWFNGTGGPGAWGHDATYSGRVLYAYSNSGWATATPGTNNNTYSSRLHPDLSGCFNINVPGNFNSYQTPTGATTASIWLNRVRSVSNWSSYVDCNTYLEPPPMFPISNATVWLECTTNCTGCAPLTSTLKLHLGLPTNWGPFNVTYSNGSSNFVLSNATDGQTFTVVNNASVTYTIVSLSAPNGCPLDFSFEAPSIVVDPPPIASDAGPLVACGNGNVLFDLTQLNSDILNGQPGTVKWYTNETATNLIANPSAYSSAGGTVYARVNVAGGCASNIVAIQLEVTPSPTSGTGSNLPAACFINDGGETLDLSTFLSGESPGGTWSLGTGSSNPGANFDALAGTLNTDNLAAGNYAFTYSVSASGCGSDAETISFLVKAAPVSSSTPVNVACFGENTGKITVNPPATGGPFQFNIGNGNQGGNVFQNLPAGDYTITVSNAGGCTATVAASVTEPAALQQDLAASGAACGGNNGSIAQTISGGTGPFTFDWADVPGSNNPKDRAGIAAGNYAVTVTDAQGCTNAATAEVTESGDFTATATPTNITCESGNSGGITLVVVGTGPFQYDWADLPGNNNPADRNNLTAGDYSVTIILVGSGCTQTISTTLTNGSPIVLSCSQLNAVSTNGASDGKAQITATGNLITPLSIAWDGPNNGSQPMPNPTHILTGLQSGTYHVAVTNGLGCTGICSFTINSPVCGEPDSTFLTKKTCNPANVGLTSLVLQNQAGCDSTLIINTLLESDTFTLHLESTALSIQAGDSVQLQATTNIIWENLIWENSAYLSCSNCLNPFANPIQSTLFTLTAIDANACSASDSLLVEVLLEGKNTFVPNAFYPSKGPLVVFADASIRLVKTFQVFDRWGEAMFVRNEFQPNDPAYGWDGKYRNKDLPMGVYVWFVQLEFADGTTEVRSGDVTVFR